MLDYRPCEKCATVNVGDNLCAPCVHNRNLVTKLKDEAHRATVELERVNYALDRIDAVTGGEKLIDTELRMAWLLGWAEAMRLAVAGK